MLVSNFGWTGGGGGGGTPTVIYFSVTKAQLDTLILGSTLVAGATYLINDRGDNGLIFTAVSSNEIAQDGTRRMLCPATYRTVVDIFGNDWIGVWNITKAVVVGQLSIWGGLVWQNTSGNIGTADDDITLNIADWVVIPKASFGNSEYIQIEFSVVYDYANDWISKQWDTNGNVFGEAFSQSGNALTDYCSMSDWNMGTLYSLFDNNCIGIFNNSNSGSINNNNPQGVVSGNYNSGAIYSNRNIKSKGSEYSSISDNTNSGDINSNSNNGTIGNNSNVGSIIGNSNSSSIIFNSNNGNIFNNLNRGAINNNANNGSIQYNTTLSAISYLVGGISGVGDYQRNFDDFSFDIFITVLGLTVGIPVYYNAIIPKNTIITEITAKGHNLYDGGFNTAMVSVGIETDDPLYLPASSLASINSGVKVSSLSLETTSLMRRIIIEATVNDVISGELKINVKTL